MSISKKIVVPVIIINFLSLMALLSTSIDKTGKLNLQDVFLKQILFIIVGWVVFFVISKIDLDYLKFSQTNILMYIGIVILLILTAIFGPTINYAKRWLVVGGMQIQPSEFAKIVVIFYTAYLLISGDIKKKRAIIISFLASILLAVMVFFQPHGSMAGIIMIIWFLTVITILPKQLKNFLITAGGGALVMGLLFFIVQKQPDLLDKIPLFSHQKNRIVAFFNPEETSGKEYFNVDQARVAIGSGRIFGKGLGQGSQSRLRFLPEYKTDFLFASFCEEFGLVGGGLVLVIYSFLIYNIMSEALKIKDPFFSVVMFLIGVKILLELFINIGTNTGAIPATGIPLPLFSAGGSIVIATFIILGVVQNIINREKNNFDGSDVA